VTPAGVDVAIHAETLAALKDPMTYSSVSGGSRPSGGTLLQDLAIAGLVLNMNCRCRPV
jgi:hypothetical protein